MYPPPANFGSSGGNNRTMKQGDWICSECENHNFASREICNRCQAPKGGFPQNFQSGDWMCAACGNHNYASREACNKCGGPKTPTRGPSGYGPARAAMGKTRASPYSFGGGGFLGPA